MGKDRHSFLLTARMHREEHEYFCCSDSYMSSKLYLLYVALSQTKLMKTRNKELKTADLKVAKLRL